MEIACQKKFQSEWKDFDTIAFDAATYTYNLCNVSGVTFSI